MMVAGAGSDVLTGGAAGGLGGDAGGGDAGGAAVMAVAGTGVEAGPEVVDGAEMTGSAGVEAGAAVGSLAGLVGSDIFLSFWASPVLTRRDVSSQRPPTSA